MVSILEQVGISFHPSTGILISKKHSGTGVSSKNKIAPLGSVGNN